MKHLIFIRHGETQWNCERRFQGQMDSSLTEKGRLQAKLCGEATKEEVSKFEKIHYFTSDLGRAVETTKILHEVHAHPNSEISEKEQFRERSCGMVEGHSYESLKMEHPELHEVFSKRDYNHPKYNIGETDEDVYVRAGYGLDQVLEKIDDNDAALVVSHGGTMKTIFNDIISFKAHGFENTSISIVQAVRKDKVLQDDVPVHKQYVYKVIRLNDVAHISKDSNTSPIIVHANDLDQEAKLAVV